MEIKELCLQIFKLTGSVILLSTSLHITLIFYHLAFGAEQVVITEPNTLLVKLELLLALAGTCYAALLIYRNGSQVLDTLTRK